jgi:hypothetical protein
VVVNACAAVSNDAPVGNAGFRMRCMACRPMVAPRDPTAGPCRTLALLGGMASSRRWCKTDNSVLVVLFHVVHGQSLTFRM